MRYGTVSVVLYSSSRGTVQLHQHSYTLVIVMESHRLGEWLANELSISITITLFLHADNNHRLMNREFNREIVLDVT